ncbi:TPR-like protein [Serendipita vermifera]|nr:TPR-like protein [Serendipita vermifera]
MDSSPSKAGNYLSIDGGDSLSALYILDEILQRVKSDIRSKDEIQVCDQFDLIIGSGRGGLVALLLGRLKMNTTQAIQAYNSLAAVLATGPTGSKEEREINMNRFKDAFKRVLVEAGYAVDSLMGPGTEGGARCKVAVCVLDSLNTTSCQLIRSYATRGASEPRCTILQAACATIASPDAYEPVVVGDKEDKIMYIDAVPEYANPINEMLKEAENAFGKDGIVSTIISIGSGKIEQHRQQQGPTTMSLNDILAGPILDTERIHNDIQNRFQDLGIYYRFDAESSLLYKDPIEQTTRDHIKAYMEETSTPQRMDQVINSLRERKGVKALKDLSPMPSIEVKYRERPGVVPFFVGRHDILEHLHKDHIHNPNAEKDQPIISVLTGLGGSGKTQTALQFAKQFETINPYLLVFFVDASSEDRIKEDYRAIIRSRGIAHRSSNHENAIQWLRNADTPWLIIADNADDPDFDLNPYIPRCARGHLILTTRNKSQSLMARTHTHHIDALNARDSVKLLLDISGYEPIDINVKHATAIAEILGHLPLAIVQAAGYIYRNQCLSTYIKFYNESRDKFLAHRAKELPQGYNLSVATTLEMSFKKLPTRSKQALCILSFFHNTLISHAMLETAAGNNFFYSSGKASEADREKLTTIKSESDALCRIFCPGGQWSEHDFFEITKPCFQYSLLQCTTSASDRKFYSMHILVQSWLQIQPIPNEKFSSRSLATRILFSVVQEGSLFQHFNLHQTLLPHLREFMGQPLGVASDDALLYRVLSDCREDPTAMIHMEAYIDRLNNNVESNALERLKALRDLTWTLVITGRSNEAVKTGEEAVGLCIKSLGKDDPVLLMTMVNLAVAYRSVGRYEDACKLDEEASDRSRKTLGLQHTNTLNAMSSLALDYSNLGNHKKARNLNQETLALYWKVLGPEHPDTLASMARLAVDYRSLGEYESGRSLNEETLAVHRKIMGPEHQHTLISMGELALDYHQLGDHEKAQRLEEETFALRKQILGLEHPHTLVSMGNLAGSYIQTGEYKKSQDLNKEVLTLRKRILGPEHPDTFLSMNSLALSYSQLGEQKKSQDLNKEVLTLRKRILGPEHPHTLTSMSNLALNYSSLGEYQKARSLNQETLILRKKALGPEHPYTLASMNNLAQNYMDLNCFEEAEKILDEKRGIDIKKNTIY